MASTAAQQLEVFLDEFTPDVAATGRAALRKVRRLVPPSIEMVYDNWNGLVVGFGPSMRATDAVLSVAIFPDHVTLCFLYGVKLADPKRLLAGGGNQVRHIKLKSAADLDRPEIKDLIRRAIVSGPATFEKSLERTLVIKSISPKRRPRRPLSADIVPRMTATRPTTRTVGKHFDKADPVVRKCYERILGVARKLGDFEEDPKRTSIHLVRDTAFAGIATRKQALILTIKSDAEIKSPRVKKSEKTSAKRWHIEVRVDKPSDIDTEIAGWLENAYALS
jgi:hypothetical protein